MGIKDMSFFFTGFLMASPAFSELSSEIRIPVEKYKLKNGLTVLLNPNPSAGLAGYYLGIAVGSRHEREGLTGISHMFEHLMFKGTEKYPHIEKTYKENQVTGLNAHTSYDYTGYYAQFPEEKLNLILDVEADRMVNLQLTQEDLNRERRVVLEERRMSIDNNPHGRLFEKALDTVFQKHSYRWPILGYSKDIAGYTLSDLNKWYRAYYTPNNAVLALSGKFSRRKAKKLIDRHFALLPSQKIPEEKIIPEPEQTRSRFAVLEKDVQVSSVFMVWRVPGYGSREALALRVISNVLGAGESGRLYKTLIRDKKLLQDISCWMLDLLQAGLFVVSYTLPKGVEEAGVKKEILRELNKIAVEGIRPEELEKTKNIQLNSMVNRLKTASSRARLLAFNEMSLGDYRKLYFNLDQLDSLSRDFIKGTADGYLGESRLSYLKLVSKKGI